MDVAGGGRLLEAITAPPAGVRTHVLARADGFAVEQILSGRLAAAVDYDQDHDEWVVVLEGSAALEVDGDVRSLAPGDWLLIPAHVPHRLIRTEPGTSWLAIRGDRGETLDERVEREGRSVVVEATKWYRRRAHGEG